MIRPQYTTTKNRSIIGWQIKSDWFSTLDLGFTLLPALVKLYYLWASTNPLVAKVIYFQKRVDSLLSLPYDFSNQICVLCSSFVSIEFCRPLDTTYLPIICQMLQPISLDKSLTILVVLIKIENLNFEKCEFHSMFRHCCLATEGSDMIK